MSASMPLQKKKHLLTFGVPPPLHNRCKGVTSSRRNQVVISVPLPSLMMDVLSALLPSLKIITPEWWCVIGLVPPSIDFNAQFSS